MSGADGTGSFCFHKYWPFGNWYSINIGTLVPVFDQVSYSRWGIRCHCSWHIHVQVPWHEQIMRLLFLPLCCGMSELSTLVCAGKDLFLLCLLSLPSPGPGTCVDLARCPSSLEESHTDASTLLCMVELKLHFPCWSVQFGDAGYSAGIGISKHKKQFTML